MEISISSHIIRENQLKNKLKSDRLLYKATALDAPANTSAEQPIGGGSPSSAGKSTQKKDNTKENAEINEYTPNKLRVATDADLDSNAPLYMDGKRVYATMVVRKGEQVGAGQMGAPEIDAVYLSNGKSVKVGDLMVEDVAEVQPAEQEQSAEAPAVESTEQTPVTEEESSDTGDGMSHGVTISDAEYTTKRGKVLAMKLVKFDGELSKEQMSAAKKLAKELKGWWSKDDGGFLMRDEESAQKLASSIGDAEQVADAQPLSLDDIKEETDEYVPRYDEMAEDAASYKYRDELANSFDSIDDIDKEINATKKKAQALSGITGRVQGKRLGEVYDSLADEKGKLSALYAIRQDMLNAQLKKDAQEKYGVKVGDKVTYKGKEATITDFEAQGPVLDVGMAPVMYEIANWEDVVLPKKETESTAPKSKYKEGDIVMFANAQMIVDKVNADGTYNLKADINYVGVYHSNIREEDIRNMGSDESEEFYYGKFKNELNKKKKHSLANLKAILKTLDAEIDNQKAKLDINPTALAGEEMRRLLGMRRALVEAIDGTPKTEGKAEGTKAEPKEKKASANKLVSDERYEQLKARLKAKLGGQANVGIDPEILAIGTEMAVYHIEKGARAFSAYAKAMIDDMGDVIRPYLKAFYNGVRDLPEVEQNGWELTEYEEVRKFDVANFDKPTVNAMATAEMVSNEQKADKTAEKATEEIAKKRNSKRKETEDKLVNSQSIAPSLFDEVETEASVSSETTPEVKQPAERNAFIDGVADKIERAMDGAGNKPFGSIVQVRKFAKECGLNVDDEGRDDILLQELVERALVKLTRKVLAQPLPEGKNKRWYFEQVSRIESLQPTISARSSNRIAMQQYSTPLSMSYVACQFITNGEVGARVGRVLEPTAGNGLLLVGINPADVHANELDETRLSNLKDQHFAMVTNQDATLPFEGGKQYDAVIANPPFGSLEGREYDGKYISGLDPQITLNALESMKDDGRAAIIIGGNMEYAKNGSVKDHKAFWSYLYDHYNVKGVIDMDGSMYAKQGTTFPTRMILIEGRRSEADREQTAVFPPVQGNAQRKAMSSVDLYNTLTHILNDERKTDGTEVLRSTTRRPVSDSEQGTRESDKRTGNSEHSSNDRTPVREGRKGSVVERDTQDSVGHILSGDRGQDSQNAGRIDVSGTGNEAERSRGNTGSNAVRRLDAVGVSRQRVGLEEQRKNEKRTFSTEKLPYRQHNTGFSLKSVAPASMVESMDETLSRIEEKYGNIDEFVTKELGYDSIEDMHNALAAEQVDSVAMAIAQMKEGMGFIIGDQTGVGKGRQMAALIRYAVKQGKKPVFFTQRAPLFTDIYRDLVDTGNGDLKPFIVNASEWKKNEETGEKELVGGVMKDTKGDVVYRSLSAKKQKEVFKSGKIPDEYDFVVVTYSQVNTGDMVSKEEVLAKATEQNKRVSKKDKDIPLVTPKATWIREVVKDNYLFMDESHTGAGQSNTGYYMQSISRTAKAVTYASATFAKRPDTMPLYAMRTAMSEANVKPEELIKIIERGGVTLQEIMSRALTEAGQMVRRERDMSDVRTDWETINDPKTVEKARENYDKTIEAFNAIIDFQKRFITPLVEKRDEELAALMSTASLKKGTEKMGVENVPFASKTYNYTKQLMLALKTQAIIDKVDAEIKAGRHPVIALESTMESTYKDYAGGEFPEPSFAASLLKGLDTVMQYTIKNGEGEEHHYKYKPSELGPEGEKAYYELQDRIREATADIFISPLDDIIEGLRAKGYKVGELTGRNTMVERTADGKAIVVPRKKTDPSTIARDFNSGKLDVLVLNKTASTGISLHASEKFDDQRQRSMIIAQPLSDINDYMQMIGRIDRTGQVHRGYYVNLGLPVPAENRFLMMLSTKLKSLNANTTSAQDSKSTEVEAPDLLNKYGSQVVIEYLRDNPEVYMKMGEPLKDGDKRLESWGLDTYIAKEDDARKITGYVALLTTAEQEDFYNDVVQRYLNLIKYLDETGSNDLKITVMPLRAQTIERNTSSKGANPNGDNPFAKDAYVETVTMDVLKKPMKADEVRKTIENVNGGEDGNERTTRLMELLKQADNKKYEAENERYEQAKKRDEEKLAEFADKVNAQEKLTADEKKAKIEDRRKTLQEKTEEQHDNAMEKQRKSFHSFIHNFRMLKVGKTYLIADDPQSLTFNASSPAIFCGFKVKEDKMTPSTTLAVFAVLDGRRKLEFKLSDTNPINNILTLTDQNYDTASMTTLDNWDEQVPSEARKTGYIMTGNILQAVSDTQTEDGAYPGQLISYTDMEGNIHDGILMPDRWSPTQLKNSGVPIIARSADIYRLGRGESIESVDGKVKITGTGFGGYILEVPKSKKEGGMYYNNKAILENVIQGVFYQRNGAFRADVPSEGILPVIKELSMLGVRAKENKAEKQIGNSEPFTENVTDAQQLATEAIITALGENAGLDVVMETWEEWQKQRELEGKETDDVEFSRKANVFGGNSGYVGYSMSKRAAEARKEGRYPKTDFKKNYGLSEKAFRILTDAGVIYPSEWHHTSMYGNKTTFYTWGDFGVEAFNRHRDEILSAGNPKEVFESFREEVEAEYDELYKRNSELAKEIDALNNGIKNVYQEYVKGNTIEFPESYIASNGATVKKENGILAVYDEEGKRLTKRHGVRRRDSALKEYSGKFGFHGLPLGKWAEDAMTKDYQRLLELRDAKVRNGREMRHLETGVDERDIQSNSAENAEELKRPNGTVYGWSEGNRIHLTPDGVNPNTPIHEYTHLWAKAIMQKNPKLWENVKSLLKGTPIWDEVVNDPLYENIKDNEDKVASEALSRLSGRNNAEKMERMAQDMLDRADGIFEKAQAVTLADNMRRALRAFWKWVGENLFDIKEFKSVDEVTDRVLYDLLNKTDLDLESLMGDNGIEYSKVGNIIKSKAKEAVVRLLLLEYRKDIKRCKDFIKSNAGAKKVVVVTYKKATVKRLNALGFDGEKEWKEIVKYRKNNPDTVGVHFRSRGYCVILRPFHVERDKDGRIVSMANTAQHEACHEWLRKLTGHDYNYHMNYIYDRLKPRLGTKFDDVYKHYKAKGGEIYARNEVIVRTIDYLCGQAHDSWVYETLEELKNEGVDPTGLLIRTLNCIRYGKETRPSKDKESGRLSEVYGERSDSRLGMRDTSGREEVRRRDEEKEGINSDIDFEDDGLLFRTSDEWINTRNGNNKNSVEREVADFLAPDELNINEARKRSEHSNANEKIAGLDVANMDDIERSERAIEKGLSGAFRTYYDGMDLNEHPDVPEVVKEAFENAEYQYADIPAELKRMIKDERDSEESSQRLSELEKGLFWYEGHKEDLTFAPYEFFDNDGKYVGAPNSNDGVLYRTDEQAEPFYSNALRAVENIKQEKATPEQWLKMIEKAGGLKKGEDKWMGLSEWLKDPERGKNLTKQEVMDFIANNAVKIEEVEYAEDRVLEDVLADYQKRFDDYVDEAAEEMDEDTTYQDWYEYAMDKLVDEEGDDFRNAVYYDDNGKLEPETNGYTGDLTGEAEYYLTSGEVRPINSTRLDYTTKGLSNKKEIAMTTPNIDSYNSDDEIHFGDAGDGRAVVWVRFGDTTDADGKKVLVIDEVQSKRHQDGREKGYVDKKLEERFAEARDKRLAVRKHIIKKYGLYGGSFDEEILNNNDVSETDKAGLKLAKDEFDAVNNEYKKNGNGIGPDAPFDKNWMEVGMKRMLRYAAENGYDKVAWTTGKQQAERYDLSTKVDGIYADYFGEYSGTKEIRVFLANGDTMYIRGVDRQGNITYGEHRGKNLSDVVGKEISEKLLGEEPVTLRGVDLSFGGEGMKGFYDMMIPKFMDKYCKKWGTKTHDVVLNVTNKSDWVMHAVDVTPEMKESVMKGQPMFRQNVGFADGEVLELERDEYGDVSVPGVIGAQSNPDKLLDAFRNKYPNYIADLNAERDAIVVKKQWADDGGVNKRSVDAVKELAKQWGADVEVLESTGRLTGRRKKAKGWYDPRTDKIVIVAPNHATRNDIMKTLLHEAVAHYGLRRLFGKDFETFLDNVFNNVPFEIRRRIVDLAARNGWDFRKATEEYLATMAEDVNFERAQQEGWWLKVRQFAIDMLRKAGFKMSLSDADLRYILWKSYDNLNNKGHNIMKNAEDVVMREKLGVGKSEKAVTAKRNAQQTSAMYDNFKAQHPDTMMLARNGNMYEVFADDADVLSNIAGNSPKTKDGVKVASFPASEIDKYLPKLIRAGKKVALVGEAESEYEDSEDGLLYRDGESKALARDIYEADVKSGLYQTKEAMLDSMAGLEAGMKAILGKDTHVEDVAGFENAYLGENRLSSKKTAV